MSKRKHIKTIRLHHEGKSTLIVVFIALALLNGLVYWFTRNSGAGIVYILPVISILFYGIIVNFFRCPIRVFEGEVENNVVAGADGKIVVIEEVEENEYFHDKRLLVSIFMSVTNVHANWFPVQGLVKMVKHHNGKFYKAWLPKSSTDNERSTIVIETPAGQEVLVRQIAGAVARRIVTYAVEGEECYIDEHLGFIKFGSRVDIYLPLNTSINVQLGDLVCGNQTVIGHLHP